MNLTIFSDGLCDPNPGTGTWAWLAISESGEAVAQASGAIAGQTTNNVAEYYGVGYAMAWLAVQESLESVLFCVDSQLVLNQIIGEWECYQPPLVALRDRCRVLSVNLPIEWKWVPSAENKADALTRETFKQVTGREAKVWHRSKRAA
jgi:ribonuclease HI